MKSVTDKQKKIVQAKLLNKKNSEIGAEVYPTANPTSQRQLVYKELKKPEVQRYLEQSKLQVLKKYNITWDSVMQPRVEALTATKHDPITKELITDHTTRLKASDSIERMLQAKDIDPTAPNPLTQLPTDIDEVQLIRLLKNNQG